MTYKIELCYLSGWDDAGWSDEGDDGARPVRFKDRDAAQVALVEYFDIVKTAIREGNMDVEESAADYRIVEAID